MIIAILETKEGFRTAVEVAEPIPYILYPTFARPTEYNFYGPMDELRPISHDCMKFRRSKWLEEGKTLLYKEDR